MLAPSKLKEYQENPALFIKEVLDDHPRWKTQIDIIESVRDYRNTYVKACHGVGKTFIAKDVILWFLYCFQPSTVLTTAPSWPQVEKLLWSEINYAHAHAKAPLGGSCKKTQLFLDDNWFALGISPRIDTEDDGKRLTGFHNKHLLVVFDEAPACNPKLWDIKETLMTSANVRFLAIGNPVEATGHFYNGFRKEHVNAINMNIFDSPNFKENKIKNVKDLIKLAEMDIEKREKAFSKMTNPYHSLTTPRWAVERLLEWKVDSPMFKSRVIGEFPDQTTDTIISLSSLEKCKNGYIETKTGKILSVDVARFGSDFTVIYGTENGRQIYKEKWNGQDLVKTANILKNKILYEQYLTVVVDDTGLGGGVTDILRDFIKQNGLTRVNILPVNFAQKSQDEQFDGIVTEMWFNAKRIIEDMEILINDEGNLFSELTDRKYKFTVKGKFKVESKDEYKKRSNGKSPDEADALILNCWGMRNNMFTLSFDSIEDRVTNKMDF
jgi:hypothetical protein